MRVFFLNRFYWPDETATAQLLTDLAERLAARGFEVTVIASCREAGATRAEIRRGVRIVRTGPPRRRSTAIGSKAWDFGAYFVSSLARLARLAQAGDTVVAMTDPPLIGVGASAVAAWRGAVLIHWVQDIYPEIAMEVTGRRILRPLRGARNRSWRRARACVTLGADMGRVLARNGVADERLKIVPNWAPAGVGRGDPARIAEIRRSWGAEGKFVVAYSGNLGRVHDLEPVLELAGLFDEASPIRFVFIGAGPRRQGLEEEARRRGLHRVRFFPPEERALLGPSLAAADVHLVTLRPGCEDYVFPSKLYGAAASGRPILFIGPPGCGLAGLVRLHGMGRTFSREQTSGMAQALAEWSRRPELAQAYGAGALRFASLTGDADAAASVWHNLLLPE